MYLIVTKYISTRVHWYIAQSRLIIEALSTFPNCVLQRPIIQNKFTIHVRVRRSKRESGISLGLYANNSPDCRGVGGGKYGGI